MYYRDPRSASHFMDYIKFIAHLHNNPDGFAFLPE